LKLRFFSNPKYQAMKTLCIDAVAILICQLFRGDKLSGSFEFQQDIGSPKIAGSRTGIELDLIL
jgi:hypothetical protein